MDENAKLIKSVIILNIITLVVVIVLLGLQVYQMVTVKPVAPSIDQQKKIQKSSDNTTTSQNQQQNQQNTTTQQQNGSMPMGQQMPSGQQQSGVQSEKCGDGICDAIEKANPNLCAKDCSQ